MTTVLTSRKPVAKPKPASRAAVKVVPTAIQSPNKVTGTEIKVRAKSPIREIKPAVSQEADKGKKPKLIRDSFTIPKNEYEAIDALKRRSALIGLPLKKSEILRAGLVVLSKLDGQAFVAAVAAVPRIKTGRRPKASK